MRPPKIEVKEMTLMPSTIPEVDGSPLETAVVLLQANHSEYTFAKQSEAEENNS